jgi:uncharacterized protein (DUF1501 family)
MKVTRRDFIRGGVTAFTVSFGAPGFLSDLALAQGASRRNLVVLYLSGGNDALSTLIPYGDSFYYSRRPTIAVPSTNVLQVGKDSSGNLLGLHPRLTGLKTIFDAGHLALIQRTGYHLVHGQSFQRLRRRLARTLPRHPAVSGRSAGGLVHYARGAALARREQGQRAGDFEPADVRVPDPEPRHGE